MRCLITPLAILFALAACASSATSRAQGGNSGTNAGPNVATAGVAGAPTTPLPACAGLRGALSSMLVPTPPPAPVPALVPGSGLNRAPARQQEDFGNPGAPPTPIPGANTGVPNNVNTAVAANPGGEQWRYRWQNGNLSYWTPDNRWVYRNGNQWTTNQQPAIPVAAGPVYASPPAYGYYAPGPYGYYPTRSTPYGYSAGYGGYYNYGAGYRGGYYGPGRTTADLGSRSARAAAAESASDSEPRPLCAPQTAYLVVPAP